MKFAGIQCALVAVIARDAEMKTIRATGRAFLSLGVTTGEGEKQQYLSVLAWSDHLSELAPSLVKGVEVYIEGKLELRNWQGQDGPQHGLSVSASIIQPMALIGARKPKAPPRAKAARANGKVDSQRPLTMDDRKPFDDAMPF